MKVAVVFAMAILSGCTTNSSTNTTVYLTNVMASPGEYDGHTIRVHGYLTLEFENTAMYSSKHDCLNRYLQKGIWVDIQVGQLPEQYERCGAGWAIGQYQRPRGSGSGHFGDWTGELASVSSFGQESKIFRPRIVIKTTLSDVKIRKLIVGTWIASPASSDYHNKPSSVTFSPNGSAVNREYADAERERIVDIVTIKYRINDGTCQLIDPDGSIFTFAIVSIDPNKMAMRSLDSGLITSFIR